MSDFHTFKSQFAGDIVTPNDPDYIASIARWAANAQLRAKIVAFVKTAEDVALSIAYARANGLEIAIRGGGHNAAGASSTEGGLVIDLSRHINKVRVDETERLAYVGGGALWETVDKETIKFGLAAVAGTVNHTGVGGLTLGGGFGYLTPKYGLVVDNLVQATVVIADGTIVTTNSDSHPDLFFGIRGGGCNFGVVTEFVYRLHPQRRTVYGGVLAFASSALERVINFTRDWWPNATENEAMLQGTTPGPDGSPTVLVVLFYNGPEEEGRARFKELLDIGPIDDGTREMPYEEVNSLVNVACPHGDGVYMKGMVQHTPHYPTVLEAHQRALQIYNEPNLSSSAVTARFHTVIFYEYIPLTKINSFPRDNTAIRRDSLPGIVFFIQWKLTTAAPDADIGEHEKNNVKQASQHCRELIKILTAGQPSEVVNGAHKFGYGNHDPEGVTGAIDAVQGKAKLAFGDNYPRLQEVKKKYDPDQVFNKWFPITPAA